MQKSLCILISMCNFFQLTKHEWKFFLEFLSEVQNIFIYQPGMFRGLGCTEQLFLAAVSVGKSCFSITEEVP